MKSKAFLAISVIIFSLSVLSCGHDGSADKRGAEAGNTKQNKEMAVETKVPQLGGTLVIGMQQEPEILNDAINSMLSVVYVCNLVFSKFVKNNERMELVPDLIREIPTVENGGISPDYLTYTYHLRRDAYWHDGIPVTSADVEFTYRVMMNPEINVETRQGWDVVKSVETPDSFTVVFHLKKIYANFVGDCFYDESVLPKHLLADKLGPGFQSAAFHRAPIGSGPFKFKEWVPGSHITLEANRDYYGNGPYLDRIIIKFVPDGNALLMQMEAGELMAVDNAPNSILDLAHTIGGIRLYKNPALFNEHLDLNCENPILTDRRVRRALALATDREEISGKIYRGVWIPAYSDEHPLSPYHTDVWKSANAFDIGMASRLLADAGWRDTNGDGIREKNGEPLELDITTTAGRLNRERTELVLKEQYKRIGVNLKIKNYHPTVLFASFDDGGILRRGKYDIALYASLNPPDPSTMEGSYSEHFLPPAGQNFTRIKVPELTRLLALGSSTVRLEERKKVYHDVDMILAREVPVIPLLWVTQIDVMPARLHNYKPNPTQSCDSWNANEWWLERER